MLTARASTAGHEGRDELTRQLTGLPFPMMTEDLMEVGLRLLLPPRILSQLDGLPLHMRFYSAAEVGDFVSTGAMSGMRGA